jgi:hypothetical protein
VLSLRVSRDKRGYDHIYLLLESRRKGRTVTRLLYGGRWPSPMKIGQQPLDEAMRKTLEQAYPEVTFDWAALQRTLQQALATPRAPMTPENRRRSAAGRGGEGRESRPASGPGGGGQGQGGRQPQQGPGRVPQGSRSQMPPRQRPPYAPGFGDQGEQERRAAHQEADPRTLDDTADLPFHGAEVLEPDADSVDLPIQPYDEPVLEEGLDTEARRLGLSEMPIGPEEIEPVEERTFVVSSGDDDTGEHALAMDEPAELAESREPVEDRAGFVRTTFEPTEIPGTGFTRDEFPVAADDRSPAEQGGVTSGAGTDPSAPPRRRRRRRRGGRRSHGGPNAASQPGGGPSPDAGGEPDDIASGPDDQDDDSDV